MVSSVFFVVKSMQHVLIVMISDPGVRACATSWFAVQLEFSLTSSFRNS